MFLSIVPRLAGVDGIRAKPYNERVLMALVFRPILGPLRPLPPKRERALHGFQGPPFSYAVIDRPALVRGPVFGLGGDLGALVLRGSRVRLDVGGADTRDALRRRIRRNVSQQAG